MSNRKRKQQKRPHLNTVQLLMREKAKKFIAAEKTYWKAISSLRQQRHGTAISLALPYEEALPENISSTVWGLKDGVAFVRHKTVGTKARVDFRALPITLEQWGKEGLIAPLENGDVSLALSGIISGLGNIWIINCQVNDVQIPYVAFSHLRYGDTNNTPSVERAVLDFQLALLGLQTQPPAQQGKPISSVHTVEALKNIADTFEKLLNDATKEEELQVFLKSHSFIMHPSAECIPKKKLGEDFVTDFVLVATTMQGPSYILVELERASHPLLTKDLTLSSPVSHAIKQTRDWDVWLEKNKAYIQNKLPGFETPSYLVVIGRGHQLTEDEKTYLRSYNRDWRNTSLLTYDDLLSRFRSTIANLKSLSQIETANGQ
jgi:hypothetical protein